MNVRWSSVVKRSSMVKSERLPESIQQIFDVRIADLDYETRVVVPNQMVSIYFEVSSATSKGVWLEQRANPERSLELGCFKRTDILSVQESHW